MPVFVIQGAGPRGDYWRYRGRHLRAAIRCHRGRRWIRWPASEAGHVRGRRTRRARQPARCAPAVPPGLANPLCRQRRGGARPARVRAHRRDRLRHPDAGDGRRRIARARPGALPVDDPDRPLGLREPGNRDPRRDGRSSDPRQAVQHRGARARHRALVRPARTQRAGRAVQHHGLPPRRFPRGQGCTWRSRR